MATKKTRTRRIAKKTSATKAAPALTGADTVAALVETKAYDFPSTVLLMDQASQHAFNKIASIARLARAGVSTIDGQFGAVSPDDIQNALTTIIAIAGEAKNDINVLAEDVDCSHSEVPRAAA